MTWCTVYKALATLLLLLVIGEYLFDFKQPFLSATFENSSQRALGPNTKKPKITGKLLQQLLDNATIPSVRSTQPLMPTTAGHSISIVTPENCSISTDEGPLRVQVTNAPSVLELEQKLSYLSAGGRHRPASCGVEGKVALVVPFRCRAEHLLLFLAHMHPFLTRQRLDYAIFVVEQATPERFNRASLMNVGFVEALKEDAFDCFIFHDVDLLPEDARNLYACPTTMPRHMSVAVDVFDYALPYRDIFGGVSAISTTHFRLLNGFSNSFWGWGGEDDDMSNRIRYHGLFIARYPRTIAKYRMLAHRKEKPNPDRYEALKNGKLKYDSDGLSNLQYSLLAKKRLKLYTWLLVHVGPT